MARNRVADECCQTRPLKGAMRLYLNAHHDSEAFSIFLDTLVPSAASVVYHFQQVFIFFVPSILQVGVWKGSLGRG